MAQHLVLAMLAAPLLLAGATGAARAAHASAGRPRRRAGRLLHARALRLLTSPPLAFALFAATILATHLTPCFDAAVRHPGLHALEHALYLATALPVLGAHRRR